MNKDQKQIDAHKELRNSSLVELESCCALMLLDIDRIKVLVKGIMESAQSELTNYHSFSYQEKSYIDYSVKDITVRLTRTEETFDLLRELVEIIRNSEKREANGSHGKDNGVQV